MDLLSSLWQYSLQNPILVGSTVVAAAIAIALLRPNSPSRKNLSAPIKDPKPGTVYLFQFPYNFGRNVSPFCLKLETYLKVSGIPYEVVKGDHYMKSPTSKMPFVQIGNSILDDSGLIIEYLKANMKNIDSDLTPEQKATTVAIRRLVEEHLAQVSVYFRWINKRGSAQWLPAAFKKLPAPLKLFVPKLVQGNVKKGLWGHGMGRHTEKEMLQMAEEDLTSLETLLGSKKLFFGRDNSDKQLHEVDIVVYSLLSNILLVPVETDLQDLVKSKFAKLVAFVNYVESIVQSVSPAVSDAKSKSD